MTNLTPVPTIDKNGVATTKHKNLSAPVKSGADRLGSVSAAPTKFPTRTIRSIIAEEYPNMDDKRRAVFVSRALKDIMPVLEGTKQHFGTPSEAIAQYLGYGKDARGRAERIIEAAGIPNDKAEGYPIPDSAEYAAKDAETLSVINGDVTSVGGKFKLGRKSDEPTVRSLNGEYVRSVSQYGNPFYTSQILNRNIGAEEKDPTMLGSYYDFEYMGASEYEWGAIPKSRDRLISADELQYASHTFTFEGVEREVHFVGTDVAAPIAYLKSLEEKGEGLHIQNKIGSGFNDSFNAGSSHRSSSAETVWWALNSGSDGDFLYALDKDRAEDAAKVIRRSADKSQKFTKVDVQFV